MRCNDYSAASASLSGLVEAQGQHLPEEEVGRLLALQVRPELCSVYLRPAFSGVWGCIVRMHWPGCAAFLSAAQKCCLQPWVHELPENVFPNPAEAGGSGCRVRSALRTRRAAPWHRKPGSGGTALCSVHVYITCTAGCIAPW